MRAQSNDIFMSIEFNTYCVLVDVNKKENFSQIEYRIHSEAYCVFKINREACSTL